jgi:hypothetical protein
MSKLVENLISKSGLNTETIQQLASQVPELSQALNLIGNPQDIVNGITSNAASAIGERGSLATQELATPIPLSMTFQSNIDSLLMFRNVSVVLIILWSVVLIINKFTDITSEETKDKIEFINNTLIGNNGVISLIIFIWLFTLIIVTLLPIFAQLEGIVPKIMAVLAIFLGGK